MSDIVVPITSPVHLTNIEDIHAVDLHVKYCELVKAYEQLVCSPSWEHGLLGSSELQCCVPVSLLSLGSSGDEPGRSFIGTGCVPSFLSCSSIAHLIAAA